MIVKQVQAKSILSKSQIHPYVVNPYIGCQHGCLYCYARFMKRFTGHREPWGEFVDVKINAPDLLRREIAKKKPGTVWVSGVCDPYQPFEAEYQLTRQCLGILVEHDWPVVVQTRSPLVLRDMDVLQKGAKIEVGFSIPTAADDIRVLFEPEAPPIASRIEALGALHAAGIKTYAMIAPLLPGAEDLSALLAGKIDRVIVDRMNYHNADGVYRQHGLEWALAEGFYAERTSALSAAFAALGIAFEDVARL